jgi:hypothetical protein
MSSAGASAQQESARQAALAAEHRRAADAAEQASARYLIAAVTEESVAKRLTPLSALGHYLLPDRAWPGSRSGAQVDLIVVGPGGLFIVDTKAWKEVTIAAGHIYRGQADVTDDLDNLADLGDSTEQAMAEVGLPPGEVHTIAVLAGHRGLNETVGRVRVVGEHDILKYIASRGGRLTSSKVDVVLSAALAHFPVLGAPAAVAAPVVVSEPVLPEPTIQIPLITDQELEDAVLEGIMAAPIEDWMSFLHPDQARLVRRSFSGPSRIRGAAGTGKTVVGLHRAAYLARRQPGRVLVTTFVKSLPAVLATLLHRMAPDVSDRVDFLNVHAFALRLSRERGISCGLDSTKSRALFDAAWKEVGVGGPLAAIDRDKRYWDDEIQHVIKGRGINRFDVYADLARVGRRRTLRTEQRRAVWDLYVAYERRLRADGVHDFADVISLAAASLRQNPLNRYGAVIVDEAQDLSCEMIRMLHGLVGNRADGLTLIGDGHQTIYPGGFTLAEAGISLTGRGVVMTTNYRNTAEILAYAADMVADLDVVDLEGLDDDAPTMLRTGDLPQVSHCTSRTEHDEQVVAQVRRVTATLGTSLGDVAVLGLDRRSLDSTMKALQTAGIPVVDLDNYDGARVDAVKIGTIKRGKGLEFKQVLLAGIRSNLINNTMPRDAADLERHELMRRELYVGVTRARDGLWVGVLP